MRAPDFWAADCGPWGKLAAGSLTPLAAAWQTASRLRRAVARPYRAPVPVLCVGNLVAGGAGKTPVVLSLIGLADALGARAHVVTRGYGGRLAGPLRVDPAVHDAAAVGDEPLLLAARAPCWVARDRAAGIAAAAAAGADGVVLDDGFQNPTIAADVGLLVVDTAYGFGNGRVMPAGPLREPAAEGLARAGAVVLIGDGAVPEAAGAAGCPILRARLDPLNGEPFAGARVVAFAGIGRPARFFASLRASGADIVASQSFPDHHHFRPRELARLRQEAARAGARLVTTAKDWARLPPPERAGIAVLDVAIGWHDPAAITRLLTDALHRDCDGHHRRAVGG